MEELNYDDYKNKETYVVHEELLKKTLELANEIIKEKNIDVSEYNYIDDLYDRLYEMFYKDINLCTDIKILIRELGTEYHSSDKNPDIEGWITAYNYLVDEYNAYLITKKEIDERGYEIVYDELINKIESLFKEMLDYKKKDYNETDGFKELLSKIKRYYQYNILEISNLQSALMGFADGENIDEQSRHLNKVERVMLAREFFNSIKNNYKENAFLYRDYELKEGEELHDIFLRYLDRSFDLYREMLDFLKVEYDKEKPPIHVIDLTKKYYPFYIDYIDDKNKPYFNPYAATLTRMDEYYEIMSSNYKKDFINEINRYQKYVRNNQNKAKEEICNELNMTIEEIDKIEEIINDDSVVEEYNREIEIEEETIKELASKIDQFNERDKKLLDYRFGFTSGIRHSYEETEKEFNITKTRIRQIESRAIRKIRKEKKD